ncbi:MAG: hypothetical protein LAN64_13220 [Acidobacteriia bacterium]|nr:hypothetical protein [Terriglobia bacterium]
MRHYFLVTVAWLALASAALAVPKQHVVSFGKWMPVKLFLGPNEDKSLDIRIRSLYVDGRLREFVTGDPHDITERLFVVRRAYRLNDWLPSDEGTAHKWKWQRGGWLLVDRDTGRVSQLNLPSFDAFYSLASWYRDYAAYCGVSDDGAKLYAVVAQVGSKKPVLKRELGPVKDADMPDAQCVAPQWQRQPTRVTFNPAGAQKLTFNIRGHAADLAPAPNDPGDEDKH